MVIGPVTANMDLRVIFSQNDFLVFLGSIGM